jgi:hypothetical protein
MWRTTLGVLQSHSRRIGPDCADEEASIRSLSQAAVCASGTQESPDLVVLVNLQHLD